MIRIVFFLFVFFSLPFFLVAPALKSWIPVVLGVLAGAGGSAWVRIRGRERLVEERKPSAPAPAVRARLERIFGESAPGGIRAEFLVYRSAEPGLMVELRGRGSLTVWVSVALLETATDEGLAGFFRGLDAARLRRIRVANFQDSARRCFDGWKGAGVRFRHWLVSFWLYPLERLLGIARI